MKAVACIALLAIVAATVTVDAVHPKLRRARSLTRAHHHNNKQSVQPMSAVESGSFAKAAARTSALPAGGTWTDSLDVEWNGLGGVPFNWNRAANPAPALVTKMWPAAQGSIAKVQTQSFPPRYVILSQANAQNRPIFYHSTDAQLNWPAANNNGVYPDPTRPMWITNDLEQSISAGLTKLGGNVAAGTFYVYEITVKQGQMLQLYPLPPCASTGTELIRDEVARLNIQCTNGHANNPQPQACLSTKVLMSLTGDVGHIKTICAAWQVDGRYDGWRSPWDQDEIMICPHAVNKLNIPARVTAAGTDHGRKWTCGNGFTYRTLAVNNVAYAAQNIPAAHPHTALGGNYVCRDYTALNALMHTQQQANLAMMAPNAGQNEQNAAQLAQTAVQNAVQVLAQAVNGLWNRYAQNPQTAGLFSFEYTVSNAQGNRFNPANGLGHNNMCAVTNH